jgi:hypothetical protein
MPGHEQVLCRNAENSTATISVDVLIYGLYGVPSEINRLEMT